MESPYTDEFFEAIVAGSSSSAERIVSFLMPLVQPKSVVDVGCGTGSWCAEFVRHGVSDILGIDGEYVDKTRLRISPSAFKVMNLESPIHLDRTFDLAISMEVGEHLSPARASSFVADLTRLAPLILFSAAIPGQGGIYHINEQWQSSWSLLFQERGFEGIDCIRARFWNDEQIEFWYRQNTFLYARKDRVEQFTSLSQGSPLDIVHPKTFRQMRDKAESKIGSAHV